MAITLKQHIRNCEELLRAFPQLGTLPIVYSTDDEGNAFHFVHNVPTVMKAEDLNERYLEMEEMDNIDEGNVICIN